VFFTALARGQWFSILPSEIIEFEIFFPTKRTPMTSLLKENGTGQMRINSGTLNNAHKNQAIASNKRNYKIIQVNILEVQGCSHSIRVKYREVQQSLFNAQRLVIMDIHILDCNRTAAKKNPMSSNCRGLVARTTRLLTTNFLGNLTIHHGDRGSGRRFFK
jgi:hypothetical protein